MKKIFLLCIFCLFAVITFGQKETFDVTSYKRPNNWKKQHTENTIQFSKEDAAKGIYCLITLYRSVPGTENSKENFDLTWNSIVKEMVTVTNALEMQAPVTENGWEMQSGTALFENDGDKGVVMLASATASQKMVNLIILTNTDVYEKEMSAFLESISLKKITNQEKNTKNIKQTNQVISNAANPDGFKFSTTNFDDGWTSVIKEDWVEVTKDNIKVFLHYPQEGTVFPADPEPLTSAAWNILVAPRYNNLKNYRTAYITTYNRPYLGMGYANENSSGKNVFVLLFRQGGNWIEFVTPDKNTFIQQFKFDPETVKWDSDSDLMIALLNMSSYNKFAVAASDFKGKWTSNFSGMQQMYNVYTGNYAGMNIHQSNITFDFKENNSYYWKLIAVNGMVGNMKYDHAESNGTFSIPNNWQIKCSKIEKGPKLYHAFWSCIKGARILNLLEADAPGTGIYTQYGLAK